MLYVVAALLAVAATTLFVAANRDIRQWEDHRRQVARMRRWEKARAELPFDQAAPPRPQVDSPYAAPAAQNPPPLPPRPGQARYLWSALVAACALLVLAAALAA